MIALQQITQDAATKLSSLVGNMAVKEAKMLIAHQLKLTPTEMIVQPDIPVSQEDQRKIEKLISRRQQGEPMAKITGTKEFWSLPFKVTPDTLDPRPDTEILVESVLEHCKNSEGTHNILDLGTGTGCIILSLLSELKGAKGVAVDCSHPTLEVAKENASQLGLDHRVDFILSDWGENVSGKFDIIVSNPPYISQADYIKLDGSVRDYDPKQALIPGETGLEAYEKIAKTMQKHLAEDGIFAIEIGIKQEQSVLSILQQNNYRILAIRKDLSGIPRCIIGQLASS